MDMRARKFNKMRQLFNQYAKCFGLSLDSLQFMYNGKNISLGADNGNNNITVGDLDMNETDSIIAFNEYDDLIPHDYCGDILSITVEVIYFI